MFKPHPICGVIGCRCPRHRHGRCKCKMTELSTSVLIRIHAEASRVMMRSGTPLKTFEVTPEEWDELGDLANAHALDGERIEDGELTVFTQAGPVEIVKVTP